MKEKVNHILLWVVDVLIICLGIIFIPGITLFILDFLQSFEKLYSLLSVKLGIFIYAVFIIFALITKLLKDEYEKSSYELKLTNLEFSTLVFVVVIISLMGLGKFVDTYFHDNKRIDVFACPVDKSVKCYKLPADTIKCTDSSRDGCESWDTTIYFPNGGHKYLTCVGGKDNHLSCEDEDSNEWEVQDTGD